ISCLICLWLYVLFFFFSSRRRHTRLVSDWSSDVCSSDLQDFSHALLGIFDAIAPAASYALSRLAAGDEAAFHDVLGPTVPLSRQIGRASCRERGEISVGGGALKKKKERGR